jgi:hypothetical protein
MSTFGPPYPREIVKLKVVSRSLLLRRSITDHYAAEV